MVCLKCDVCESNKLVTPQTVDPEFSLLVTSRVLLFHPQFFIHAVFVYCFIYFLVCCFIQFFLCCFIFFFLCFFIKKFDFSLSPHYNYFIFLVCRDLFWLVASKEELTLNRLPRSLQKPSLNLEWILCKVCII